MQNFIYEILISKFQKIEMVNSIFKTFKAIFKYPLN